MNIGSVLSGAGRVSTGVREREDELRRARLDQLVIEEANRANRARQEMSQAPMPQPGSFGPAADQLPVLPGLKPPAPAVAPASTAPVAGVKVNKPPALDPASTAVREGFVANVQGPRQMTREQFLQLSPRAQKQMYDEYVARLIKENQLNRGPRDEFGVQIPTGLPQKPVPRGMEDFISTLPLQSGPSTRGGNRRPKKAGVATTGNLAVDADTAIQNVLGREGGYVNDKVDRGGETNLGISSNANPDVDVKSLTPDAAAALYKQRYWDAINADQLPPAIREIAFDTAVNMGPATALRLVQLSGGDPQRYLAERKRIYDAIVANDPTQKKFYNGWMNRIEELAGKVGNVIIPTASAELPVGDVSMRAIGVEGGGSGTVGTTPQQKSPVQFYLANPEAIGQDMQLAQQQRAELVRMAGIYQRAGMGQQYMELRNQIMALDANLLNLAGVQGVQELDSFNDPRRLARVWSIKMGQEVNFQPRQDGTFDVLVNGKIAAQGQPRSEIMDTALSMFDQSYRERKGVRSDKEHEAALKVRELMMGKTGDMIKEIYVAQQKGILDQQLEVIKATYASDIKPMGDGTVIIRQPGGGIFHFDPAGGEIEIDGVTIPITGARRVTGLDIPAGR